MREDGWTIICMEKDFIPGKMEDTMRENTRMTGKMVMEYMSGQMDEVNS